MDNLIHHTLFLPPRSAAEKTVQRTLVYVKNVTQLLRHYDVVVDVIRLRAKDASNQRVQAALRRRNIRALPALIANGTAYVGFRAIKVHYDKVPQPASDRQSRHQVQYDNYSPHADNYTSNTASHNGPPQSEEDIAAEALDRYYQEEIGGGGYSGDFGESVSGLGGQPVF